MTTMTKKLLSYSVADFVATLTINNPPVNALNHDLLQELAETTEALQGDESVRAVVLTGAGRVFMAVLKLCGGHDCAVAVVPFPRLEGHQFTHPR